MALSVVARIGILLVELGSGGRPAPPRAAVAPALEASSHHDEEERTTTCTGSR